jgi:hypothetical protein
MDEARWWLRCYWSQQSAALIGCDIWKLCGMWQFPAPHEAKIGQLHLLDSERWDRKMSVGAECFWVQMCTPLCADWFQLAPPPPQVLLWVPTHFRILTRTVFPLNFLSICFVTFIPVGVDNCKPTSHLQRSVWLAPNFKAQKMFPHKVGNKLRSVLS